MNNLSGCFTTSSAQPMKNFTAEELEKWIKQLNETSKPRGLICLPSVKGINIYEFDADIVKAALLSAINVSKS